jgi:hypothetical protein
MLTEEATPKLKIRVKSFGFLFSPLTFDCLKLRQKSCELLVEFPLNLYCCERKYTISIDMMTVDHGGYFLADFFTTFTAAEVDAFGLATAFNFAAP